MSYFEQIINKPFFMQKVIDGKAFFAEDIASVGVGNNREYHILTGAAAVWMISDINVDDVMTADFYEGPDITANGTGITLYDVNRATAGSSIHAVYHTPTIGAGGDGTLLEEEKLFASGGAEISPARELSVSWRLAASTSYLIRVINDAGAAEDVLTTFSFFED